MQFAVIISNSTKTNSYCIIGQHTRQAMHAQSFVLSSSSLHAFHAGDAGLGPLLSVPNLSFGHYEECPKVNKFCGLVRKVISLHVSRVAHQACAYLPIP